MESYWEENRKEYKKWKSIDKDIETDICIIGGGLRSEERRVGKECRSRWSPYH